MGQFFITFTWEEEPTMKKASSILPGMREIDLSYSKRLKDSSRARLLPEVFDQKKYHYLKTKIALNESFRTSIPPIGALKRVPGPSRTILTLPGSPKHGHLIKNDRFLFFSGQFYRFFTYFFVFLGPIEGYKIDATIFFSQNV